MYYNSSIKEDITGSIEIENPMIKYLPLTDEFPLNTDYIKYITKTDLYKIKIQVNDLNPILRFMRGIEVDINTK
jgi:hypothetical protein